MSKDITLRFSNNVLASDTELQCAKRLIERRVSWPKGAENNYPRMSS